MEVEYKFSPKNGMMDRECSRLKKSILLNPHVHILESYGQRVVTKYFDDNEFSLTNQKIAIRERTSTAADFNPEDFERENFFIDQSEKLERKRITDHILSFKWGGSAKKGLHIRQEVEMDFCDRDFSLLDEELKVAYKNAMSRGLAELFKTVIYRYTFLIEYRQSQIEFVIDFGYYSYGKPIDLNKKIEERYLIKEYELELKHGNKEDLLTFSESLRKEFCLIPNEKSKFQRGLELYF